MKLCSCRPFFLVFAVLFVQNLVAANLLDELMRPGCKKDLLILWDLSGSVSRNFNSVKEFVKNLIENPRLNVGGPDGTHVALITFSNGATKRVTFEDNTSKNKAELVEAVSNITKEDLGRFTRTGAALKLAQKDIFKLHSPLNAREDVDDVIILITDGEPTCNRSECHRNPDGSYVAEFDYAMRFAKILKDIQGILMVGALINTNTKGEDILKIYTRRLTSLTTGEQHTFNASVQDLPKLINSLVDPLCGNTGSACKCPAADEASTMSYVKPGVFEVFIPHHPPPPKCHKETVKPKAKTCPFYPLGRTSVNQTYVITDGDKTYEKTCKSYVYVQVIECGNVDYDPQKKVCCSGILHDIRQGWQCCGCTYYNTKEKKCCYPEFAATFVGPNENCPILTT